MMLSRVFGLSSLAALSLAPVAEGQGSTPIQQPQPNIAEAADLSLAPGLSARSSMRFNIPNGLWDHGEGFDSTVDSGGYLGLDLGSSLTSSNIETLVDWDPTGDQWANSFWRFVGALTVDDPSKLPSGPERVKPSFELFAPNNYNSSAPSVLVVSLMPTMPVQTKPTDYPGLGDNGLFTYDNPADPSKDLGKGPAPRGQVVVGLSGTLANPVGSTPNLNVFAAYIVPPEYWNPAALVIQRTHQLVRAAEIVLQQRYPEMDYSEQPIPCVVVGGSFGGYCSLALALDFPNRFHGALSDVTYLASLRRVIGVDDARELAYRLTAFPPVGAARFGPQRELQWGFGFSQLGESWLAASLVERLNSTSSSDIRRPIFLTLSDEDMVTSAGPEFLSLIDPNPGRAGSRNLGTANEPQMLYWSVREKQAHNAGKAVPSPMPASAVYDTPLKQIIVDAYASHQNLATGPLPSRSEPTLPTGWVVDPFDPVLARPGDRSSPSHTIPPSDQGVVIRNTAFDANQVRIGIGLEHCMVYDGFALVGSSDGFVSVIDWEASNNKLEVVSRSPELGYGINGMAINNAGDRLAVATYRALHVIEYNKSSGQIGQILHTTDALYSADWKYSDPRSLSYIDLFDGGGEELVYITSRGGLFVRSGDLGTEIVHWAEPGIRSVCAIDLGANLNENSNAKTQLLANSAREVLFTLELGDGPGQVYLRNVSNPADFGSGAQACELMSWPDQYSGTAVVALSDGPSNFSFFDPITLDLVASIADFTDIQVPFCDGDLKTPERSLPLQFDVLSESPFCVAAIHQNMLYLIDGQGVVIGSKSLLTLPGAIDPVSISCGDILPDNGNEVVLGTRWGSVVVLRESDITQSSSPNQNFFDIGLAGDQVLQTGAGGWAICKDPDGVEQLHTVAGSNYWLLQSDGQMTPGPHLDYVRSYTGLPITPPVLDIAHVGDSDPLLAENWANPPSNIFEWFNLTIHDFSVQQDLGVQSPLFKHVLSAVRRNARDPREYYPLGPDQVWYHIPSFVGIHNNFWVFTDGGDAVSSSGGRHTAMYWTGESDPGCAGEFRGAPNNVLRCDYRSDVTSESNWLDVTGVWGSGGTNGTVSDPLSPPDPKPAATDYLDLRNDSRSGDDWQSLRLFRPSDPNGLVSAVISTVGGYIQIMDASGSPDQVDFQSEDLGYGGLGLAVGDLDADGGQEIVFGTLYSDTDQYGLRAMSAKIGVVDLVGGSHTTVQTISLGDLGLDSEAMPGYGVAGIAIGDILSGTGYDGNEVVVTTLNGEFYIFKTDGGSPLVETPVHASVVPGALGVGNSIVIADIDATSSAPEIYVGSSQGFYRFDVVQN